VSFAGSGLGMKTSFPIRARPAGTAWEPGVVVLVRFT
jgi:hypothetical protein